MVAELRSEPPEDPRHDLVVLALPSLRARELVAQERRKGGRDGEREDAPLAILGRSRLEADRARGEVHLSPRQRLHLADAPTGAPGELDRRGVPVREVLEDAARLVIGEEALPDVVELEDRERNAHVQQACEHGQLEHAPEGRHLVVDRAPSGPRVQPRRDVARDVAVADRYRRDSFEHRPQVLEGVLDAVPRPVLLLDVVRADEGDQVIESHLLGVRRGEAAARHLGLSHAQQPNGVDAHLRPR